MDNDYEAACEALAAAIQDMNVEFGEDEYDYSDLVAAVAIQFPKDVALELCRTEVGWIPGDVRRFFTQTGG